MSNAQTGTDAGSPPVHTVSVVVPVYQGERTLASLLAEIEPYCTEQVTEAGHRYVVTEILLAYDNGPDGSAAVIRDLAEKSDKVRPVWLSRNFGQHAATLAGMASSGGDWIVTMDEDGQHDPAYIPAMLDVAMRERAGVVYAKPVNAAPHGLLRNLASKGAKRVVDVLGGGQDISTFQSYRLVLGEMGRSVAAYAGAGVYLDVALSWVNGRIAQCPIELRQEGDRPSGYSTRTLLSHFWRLVLTSGTRGLRAVALLGALFGVLGLAFAVYAVVGSIVGGISAPGWTSTVVLISLGTGAILFSLGVIAEYLGSVVGMAMGRPLYLISHDPNEGPLGRQLPADAAARES
ncbi:glycosyltransferase [Nocardioides sp. R1-1]|uniref:glycosyltransferase n=1 Tax=Nocardioides sp. R1-1 TaxID=3383502 RepID=UPI0038CF6C5B